MNVMLTCQTASRHAGVVLVEFAVALYKKGVAATIVSGARASAGKAAIAWKNVSLASFVSKTEEGMSRLAWVISFPIGCVAYKCHQQQRVKLVEGSLPPHEEPHIC